MNHVLSRNLVLSGWLPQNINRTRTNDTSTYNDVIQEHIRVCHFSFLANQQQRLEKSWQQNWCVLHFPALVP